MNHVSRSVGTVRDTLSSLLDRKQPVSNDCIINLIDWLGVLQSEIERLEGGDRANAEYGPNVIPFPLWRFPRHPSEERV